MAKTICTFSIDADLLKQLGELADAQGLSRSQLIERCVRDQIAGQTVAVQVMANPVLGPMLAGMFANPQFIKQFAAAIGDQLPAEQLPLFQRAMQGMVDQAAKLGKGKLAAPVKLDAPRRRRRR